MVMSEMDAMGDWTPELGEYSHRPWMIRDKTLYVGDEDSHHDQWRGTSLTREWPLSLRYDYTAEPCGSIDDGKAYVYDRKYQLLLPIVSGLWRDCVQAGGQLPLGGTQEATESLLTPSEENLDAQHVWGRSKLQKRAADWTPDFEDRFKTRRPWMIDMSDMKNPNPPMWIGEAGQFHPGVSQFVQDNALDPSTDWAHILKGQIDESVDPPRVSNYDYSPIKNEDGSTHMHPRAEHAIKHIERAYFQQEDKPEQRYASEDWTSDSNDGWTGPQSVDKFHVDVPGESPGMPRPMEQGHPQVLRSPCWCDCGATDPHEWAPTCENGLHPTMQHEAASIDEDWAPQFTPTKPDYSDGMTGGDPNDISYYKFLYHPDLGVHHWSPSRDERHDPDFMPSHQEEASRKGYPSQRYPNGMDETQEQGYAPGIATVRPDTVSLAVHRDPGGFGSQMKSEVGRHFKTMFPDREIHWFNGGYSPFGEDSYGEGAERIAATHDQWVWLDGKVAFGENHHDIAYHLAQEFGWDSAKRNYISNMLARNLQPEGHSVAVGNMRGGYPHIWMSTVDRNAVWDDVAREHEESMQKTAAEGGQDFTMPEDDAEYNMGWTDRTPYIYYPEKDHLYWGQPGQWHENLERWALAHQGIPQVWPSQAGPSVFGSVYTNPDDPTHRFQEVHRSQWPNAYTDNRLDRDLSYEHARHLEKRIGVPIGDTSTPDLSDSEIDWTPKFAMADDDYRGMHTAPSPEAEYKNSMDDPSDAYPPDVYGPNGARYYGHGGPDTMALDERMVALLRSVKGNPDALVTIYRAVPEGVTEINPGDWVTPMREYAEMHADSNLGGHDREGEWVPSPARILERQVRAGDLYTAADSLHEWGWHPSQRTSATKTANAPIWFMQALEGAGVVGGGLGAAALVGIPHNMIRLWQAYKERYGESPSFVNTFVQSLSSHPDSWRGVYDTDTPSSGNVDFYDQQTERLHDREN